MSSTKAPPDDHGTGSSTSASMLRTAPDSHSYSAEQLPATSSPPSSAITSTTTTTRSPAGVSASARRSLWHAVGTSITAARTMTKRISSSQYGSTSGSSTGPITDDGEARIDAEGMANTLRPLSGNYADQWQSLAHLFDADQQSRPREGSAGAAAAAAAAPGRSGFLASPASTARGSARSPRRQGTLDFGPHTPSRVRTRTSTSPSQGYYGSTSSFKSPSSTARVGSPQGTPRAQTSSFNWQNDAELSTSPPPSQQQRVSLSVEPDSMLDSDPTHIPDGADPLEYATEHDLLEDDSEEEDEEAAHRQAHAQQMRYKTLTWRQWLQLGLQHMLSGQALTVTQKGILKCAVAYYIAELFTFSEILSDWMASLLPNHDPDAKVPFSNLHLIATIAVYFHPAKTLGAMLEADFYALLAFVYAVALGLTSMATAVWLHRLGHPIVSNIISVFLFLGVGMGLVGYSKVAMGKPTFTTACSMVGVIVFTVIAKEGSAHLGLFSADKIWQVTVVVVAGTLISNAICFLVWPQSACTNLQEDIVRNLSGFSTLLKVLTKTFLLDDPSQFYYNSERIKRAIDNHHASFTSLRKNLQEARLEAPLDARMRHISDRYVKVVDSMNRLAQHLNGLRSSCGLQHQVMMERQLGADRLFKHFAANIGPHMRSLVFTCTRTLRRARATFALSPIPFFRFRTRERDTSTTSLGLDDFVALGEGLDAALRRFRTEQTASIRRMYTVEPPRAAAEDQGPDSGPFGQIQQALSQYDSHIKPDEEVFLVFFFSFNLEEFAKECAVLLDELAAIREEEERIASYRRIGWAKFWRWEPAPRRERPQSDGRRLRGLFPKSTPPVRESFPSTRPHQPNTKQTPQARTFRQRVQRLVWTIGEFFRQPNVKFAFKTGLGAAVLAAPAFISTTRPTFTAYQGQWALVSFMVVLSPTVGQSNQMSVHRVLGTIFGAAVAYGAYTIFPDNHIALPIVGVLFSLPCFRYIVAQPQLASSARFVLLTYNLTALYSYNLRIVGIEVEQVAFHRTVAVIIGVVWATILNHAIWPFEARRELALGLSDLLFKLAWLYQRLVLTYSSEDSTKAFDEDEEVLAADLEVQPLLRADKQQQVSAQFQAVELHLQLSIIKLEGLLAQTRHEPRLKGPFPITTYKSILGSCQGILDKLHSMRCVTARDAWHEHVRRDFVIPVNAQRREMVGNILLFFWLLGSAFHLKTPMPPYMPPVKNSRQALIERIRELPAVKKRAIRGGSEYLLFYSYALAMKDVIDHLVSLGEQTQLLFGVLGGSIEAFEAQFRASADSADSTPTSSRMGTTA